MPLHEWTHSTSRDKLSWKGAATPGQTRAVEGRQREAAEAGAEGTATPGASGISSAAVTPVTK